MFHFDLWKRGHTVDNEESVESLMHTESHQNVIKVKGKQLKLPHDGKKIYNNKKEKCYLFHSLSCINWAGKMKK